MKKYKLEKFSLKGAKSFIFSSHEDDDWQGPAIERNTDFNINRLGLYTKDRKFKFELDIVGGEGEECVAKALNNDGQHHGPTMVICGDCLYFGHYSSKDGFHDIVYRFKKGENVRTQLYKHGVLVDECLTDYVLLDDVAYSLPFNPNFTAEEVVERKIATKDGDTIEYVAGDPTMGEPVLAAQIYPDGKTVLGQYCRNAFNGLTMTVSPDDDTYEFKYLDNNNLNPVLDLVYSSQMKGFAFVVKKEDGGFLDLVYCRKKEGDGFEMSIMDLNDRRKPIKESKVTLPDYIDPEAPKPGVNIKAKHKPKKDAKGKTAEERLNDLVGVVDAKEKVKLLKALFKKFKGDPAKVSLHMCFTGNPGTGKTEVARLIAEILYDAGILEVNKLVETDPSGLIAEYSGQTQPKTHKVVESAMGGVLFIDEAYNLMGGQYSTKGGGSGSFGEEAIAALLQDMETYQGKFCVILAGYEDQMRNMIEVNPGFKSRITNYIDFPNYTLPELKQIAQIFIDKDGYKINDDALEEIIKYISTKTYRDDFANAREVRNVLQLVYTYQALRTVDDSDDLTITIEDVYSFLKKKDPKTVSGKTAEERLNDLIGLTSVKKELLGIEAVLIKNKGNVDKLNLNFAFTGNPGTGKTEVANLFADILYDKGILQTRNFTSTNRSGLVGLYSGHTADKTHKIFHDALGGVLFIDEAYDLFHGKDDSFGLEAIAALLEDMEKYRGKICVILAGYTREMKQLVKANSGFDSRINHWIEFPDYELEDLRKIFDLMLLKDGYSINKDAIDESMKIIEIEKQAPNFANARAVRNLFESLKQIQAVRTIDNPADVQISLADVKQYEQDHNVTFDKKAKKTDWNVSYDLIKKLSDKHGYFSFSNTYVEEASVNIRIINDGKEVGEGSGFFISPDGIIATNHHVAGEADELVVVVNLKTATGQTIKREYAAELIASDEINDIAIIGILNPDIKFTYYPLAKDDGKYPELLTKVVMGGYPFGANRFANVTLLEGQVQSINKDLHIPVDTDFIYIDMLGQPGSSGSGVIDKQTGRLISIFKGVSIDPSDLSLKMRMSIPVKYLWNLLKSLKSSKNDVIEDDYVEPHNYPRDDFEDNRRRNDEMDNYRGRDVNPYDHIHLVEGDISLFEGDAVVNAANSQLAAGGGVCGAIFDRAGYSKLKAACNEIGHCQTGRSVITPGFELKVKYIIHTVGPHGFDENRRSLLKQAYESAFELAMSHDVRTIAFPSISTGHFCYEPKEEAVSIALDMISIFAGRQVEEVYVYVKGDTAELYKAELARRKNDRF